MSAHHNYRKIEHIYLHTYGSGHDSREVILTLCTDGTLWMWDVAHKHWVAFPPIPGSNDLNMPITLPEEEVETRINPTAHHHPEPKWTL